LKFRRRQGPPLLQTVRGRRLLRNGLIIAGAALAGYLVSFRMYPAPLFSSDHSVPRVLDLGITEAQQRLTENGFRVRVRDEEPDFRAVRGRVIWQDPPPGTITPEGATVELVPSAGPATIIVPDVDGFDADHAREVIQAAGLTLGQEDSVTTAQDRGSVVATRPSAGVSRPPGTAVDLVLSSGPLPTGVPSVLGMGLQDARRVLERAGLAVGEVRTRSGSGPIGVVLEQEPASGGRLVRGGRVGLVVSGGSEP